MESAVALQLFVRSEDKGPDAPVALAATSWSDVHVFTPVSGPLAPMVDPDSMIMGTVGNRDALQRWHTYLPSDLPRAHTRRPSALLPLTVEGRTGVVVVTAVAIAVYALDAPEFEKEPLGQRVHLATSEKMGFEPAVQNKVSKTRMIPEVALTLLDSAPMPYRSGL